VITAWIKHLKTDEEKERFKLTLEGSKTVLNRLQEILNEMEASLNRAEIDPRTYELPNWDYRQAHNNGYRQCLSLVKKLTTLDQKD
jgi:hypothetical protein